jgi:hypothetical protein
MAGMGGNSWSQIAFRGRNDDGSETTATWIAPENGNWSQRPDRNFRVRLKIDNPQLVGGAAWLFFGDGATGSNFGSALDNVVSTSGTPIIAVTSPFYTDGDETTEQLTHGLYTYQTPNEMMTNNFGVSEPAQFPEGGGEVEVEWCLQIAGDSVVDGQILGLRSQFGSAVYGGGYFEDVRITVDIPRTIRRLIII